MIEGLKVVASTSVKISEKVPQTKYTLTGNIEEDIERKKKEEKEAMT